MALANRLNPGSLNKRVSVFKPDPESSDGAGGRENDWATKAGWIKVCNLWASIRPAGERAVTFAGQMGVEITHTVLIRYRDDISEANVIDFNGRKLDIRTMRNFDEANTLLQLMCFERKP